MPIIEKDTLNCLTKAVSITASEIKKTDASDLRRTSKIDQRGVTEAFELKLGWRSGLSAVNKLKKESQDFNDLLNLIAKSNAFPRWFGTNLGGYASDIPGLIAHLGSLLAELNDTKSPEEIVVEFANAIAKEKVKIRISACLENNCPLPHKLNIKVSNGVIFRRLSDDELEKMAEIDALEHKCFNPLSNISVLELVAETQLILNVRNVWVHDNGFQTYLDIIYQAHAALHCFKSGSTPIKLIRVECINPTIPLGIRQMIMNPNCFAAFNLVEDELDSLSAFLDRCMMPCRQNLVLAKNRLRDAEGRYSAIDAIVDAFIGIEALLNPKNAPELTMRVALNYASLLPNEIRYLKYKQLKDLYNIRSKIVHGNYTLGKTYKITGLDQEIELDEIGKMSKELLREIIHLFLNDEKLRKNAKLDIDFWEKQYFNA